MNNKNIKAKAVTDVVKSVYNENSDLPEISKTSEPQNIKDANIKIDENEEAEKLLTEAQSNEEKKKIDELESYKRALALEAKNNHDMIVGKAKEDLTNELSRIKKLTAIDKIQPGAKIVFINKYRDPFKLDRKYYLNVGVTEFKITIDNVQELINITESRLYKNDENLTHEIK